MNLKNEAENLFDSILDDVLFLFQESGESKNIVRDTLTQTFIGWIDRICTEMMDEENEELA